MSGYLGTPNAAGSICGEMKKLDDKTTNYFVEYRLCRTISSKYDEAIFICFVQQWPADDPTQTFELNACNNFSVQKRYPCILVCSPLAPYLRNPIEIVLSSMPFLQGAAGKL